MTISTASTTTACVSSASGDSLLFTYYSIWVSLFNEKQLPVRSEGFRTQCETFDAYRQRQLLFDGYKKVEIHQIVIDFHLITIRMG